MLRQLLQFLSPAGEHARLSVLLFHRVRPQRDELFPGEPDARAFETLLGNLKRWCNILPLPAAIQRLRSGALPARSLCITFDDGYADNCTVALPLLTQAGVRATFFVATGYLGGGRMWNDTVIEAVRAARGPSLDLTDIGLGVYPLATLDERRSAIAALLGKLKYAPSEAREASADAIARRVGAELPRNLMMTPEQVRTLHSAGMTIGAHTVTHPILAGASEAHARREIIESKRVLETLVGDPVALFAYPNGKPRQDYAGAHVELVRSAGFDAACSTAWGVASRASDVFQIPRFTPWDREAWRFGLRLAQNLRRTAYATA